ALEKIFGDFWPFSNTSREQVRVEDVSTGRVLACLNSDATAWLSEDGKTLVTEDDRSVVRVWDLPLRPSLLLVVGIPLGLGLMVLLFSCWRARRRVGTAPATGAPVMMNPEQKL